MPPPCTNDWEAVKATAIARNSIKEAAKLHNVPYTAAKKRASREKWPVGRRPAKAVREAKAFNQGQLVKANPRAVSCVTSTADALVIALENDSQETRLDLSKAARKAAKAFRTMQGRAVISEAQNLKHVVNSASQLHGWEERPMVGVNLQILNVNGSMQ
jgi:hypothetical protein